MAHRMAEKLLKALPMGLLEACPWGAREALHRRCPASELSAKPPKGCQGKLLMGGPCQLSPL